MYPLFFHFDAVNVNWNVTHEHSSVQASIHLFYDLAGIHSQCRLSYGGAVLWTFFSFLPSVFLPHSALVFVLCLPLNSVERKTIAKKGNVASIRTHIQEARCTMLCEICVLVISLPFIPHLWQFPVLFSQHEHSSLHLCCSLTRNQTDRNTVKVLSVCVCGSWRWGAFNSAVFKRRVCQSKSNGEKISGWAQDDYGNKMTKSDTMKWQNNLRLHEVRSEYNNSFALVAYFVSFLLFFLFHFYPIFDVPSVLSLFAICLFFVLIFLLLSSVDRFAVYVVVCFIYDACSRAFCKLTVVVAATASTDENSEYFMNRKSSCFFLRCNEMAFIFIRFELYFWHHFPMRLLFIFLKQFFSYIRCVLTTIDRWTAVVQSKKLSTNPFISTFIMANNDTKII